ncbi:GNAT family N-acetyltransferase [Actinocorallia longicatena]|uniref:GNAT family N-acetyltransferase n=1 Tax=Actinocorallia longicatena TaxID=111803 RepID=A0ABP6QIL7_9ACTN
MKTVPAEVTTWYLEQTSPGDLVPARPAPVQIVRAEVPSPEFARYLYTAVGGPHNWTDRLVWSHDHWQEHLTRPGVEIWTAWDRGTPAGYVELLPPEDGAVEIICFGLVPSFIGRGIGGHLLSEGTARAWDLAARWPGLPATTRVWLHTCSLDGPAAVPNYTRRGFRVYATRTRVEDVWERPLGPWPGAR